MDFAGPMYVRDIFAKGGGMNKVYIALFTCATSRAVHLELVPSLTAESFIKALARFKGRRGTPTLIVSDNGKTFKDSRVQAYCQRDGTKWRFNVEAAPWWGGFFERLVKSVKLSLKKCLRNARLNYDELSTTLVEVAAVLNSRPLTYVYDEFEEPLTPSHLVIGHEFCQFHQRTIPLMFHIPSKRFQGEQSSYRASSITSGTAGEQNISHNLENNIAVLRELAHCVRFKWEMLCAYMRKRPQDNCGDLEGFNAYFLVRMAKFEVQ